jgi:hypothetical protein
MTDSKLPETSTRPRDLTPAQQVQQARLRLLQAARGVDEKRPFKLKRKIGMSTVAFAFAAGFITGYSPSASQAFSREAASLLRLWLNNLKPVASGGDSEAK